MLSKITLHLEKIHRVLMDKETLRAAVIDKLDENNLYELMAGLTVSQEIKKFLLDVTRREKTHIGESRDLLLRIYAEYAQELVAGEKEFRGKAAA